MNDTEALIGDNIMILQGKLKNEHPASNFATHRFYRFFFFFSFFFFFQEHHINKFKKNAGLNTQHVEHMEAIQSKP